MIKKKDYLNLNFDYFTNELIIRFVSIVRTRLKLKYDKP